MSFVFICVQNHFSTSNRYVCAWKKICIEIKTMRQNELAFAAKKNTNSFERFIYIDWDANNILCHKLCIGTTSRRCGRNNGNIKKWKESMRHRDSASTRWESLFPFLSCNRLRSITKTLLLIHVLNVLCINCFFLLCVTFFLFIQTLFDSLVNCAVSNVLCQFSIEVFSFSFSSDDILCLIILQHLLNCSFY